MASKERILNRPALTHDMDIISPELNKRRREIHLPGLPLSLSPFNNLYIKGSPVG
jgi:hypothetical protein